MDPKVFEQSRSLMFKAIYLYYQKGLNQKAIAQQLNISTATASRLLARALETGVVKVQIDPLVNETQEVEAKLQTLLPIREVLVAPSTSVNSLNGKLAVALEGARYVQNNLKDGDNLGVGFGGTIHYLIHYLNPCRKKNTNFVLLHGYLESKSYQKDMQETLSRISNAFGGKRFMLDTEVYLPNDKVYEYVMSRSKVREVMELYKNLTITVSGLGSVYDSHLMDRSTINCDTISDFVEKKQHTGDIFLNFFDENGQECRREDNTHIMGIDLDTYRKVPTKILTVSGAIKAEAVVAAIRGKLVDVLIVDMPLAKELLKMEDQIRKI